MLGPAAEPQNIRSSALQAEGHAVKHHEPQATDRFSHKTLKSPHVAAPSAPIGRHHGPKRQVPAASLSGARLLTIREAEWNDGGPGKPHLFSLVRCETPGEWLELMIPTADVPLVLWSLGAGQLALAHASGPAAAPRASRRMSRAGRRWRLITAGSCWLLTAALTGTGHTGPYLVLPLVTGAFLTSGLFGQWLRGR